MARALRGRSLWLPALIAATALLQSSCASTERYRAELQQRLAQKDGVCRVYADFGALPYDTRFFEVLPEKAKNSHYNYVFVEGETASGWAAHKPFELKLAGSYVTGSVGTQVKDFAIEQTPEATTLREAPSVSITAARNELRLASPKARLSVSEKAPGLLVGTAYVGGNHDEAVVRFGNCDLGSLRERPLLLAVLMLVLEGDQEEGRRAAQYSDGAVQKTPARTRAGLPH